MTIFRRKVLLIIWKCLSCFSFKNSLFCLQMVYFYASIKLLVQISPFCYKTDASLIFHNTLRWSSFFNVSFLQTSVAMPKNFNFIFSFIKKYLVHFLIHSCMGSTWKHFSRNILHLFVHFHLLWKKYYQLQRDVVPISSNKNISRKCTCHNNPSVDSWWKIFSPGPNTG